MSAYPAIDSLLTKLLDLTDEDAQLPLEVLVNLHRAQLRAPLERLAQVETRALLAPPSLDPHENLSFALQAHVGECWPALANGRAYRRDKAVINATHRVDLRRGVSGEDNRILAGLWRQQRLVGQLIQDAREWVSYEPLVALHRMTWNQTNQLAFLPILEAELRTVPEVRAMILEFA